MKTKRLALTAMLMLFAVGTAWAGVSGLVTGDQGRDASATVAAEGDVAQGGWMEVPPAPVPAIVIYEGLPCYVCSFIHNRCQSQQLAGGVSCTQDGPVCTIQGICGYGRPRGPVGPRTP